MGSRGAALSTGNPDFDAFNAGVQRARDAYYGGVKETKFDNSGVCGNGCGRQARARGLCDSCYRRELRGG